MNRFFIKHSPTKLIAISSFFSLTVIALLSGFINLNVNKVISVQTSYATKINISGFQRMLSQRSAYFTAAYVEGRDIEDKSIAQESVQLLQQRHRQLLTSLKNPLNKRLKSISSDELNALYFELPNNLDKNLNQYASTIEEMLSNPSRVSKNDLRKLKLASQTILDKFDNVVQQYEAESKEQIRNLRTLQLAFLIAIVALFLIQVFAVINPLLKIAEKLSARLLDEANIDPLTQLHNRRLLDTLSDQVIADFKRYKKALALVIIDIDDLKKINYTYGHAVGDEAIKIVAGTIRAVSRKSDKTFRTGGEEFLLILPNTRTEGAYVLVEKIRKGVQKSNKSSDIENFRFTVSSGVSEVLASENSINNALKRADNALYQAKREDKNKTIIAKSH